MKLIKKIALAAAAVVAILASSNEAQAQQMALGVDLGYVSRNKTATIGAFFQYQLNDYVRIAPQLSGYLRHDHADAFVADINAHFPMGVSSSPVGLYPLVGINFTSWGIHFDDGAVKNIGRVGANLGAGFEYKFKDNMKFNIELKYVLTSRYSTFVSTCGLAYLF